MGPQDSVGLKYNRDRKLPKTRLKPSSVMALGAMFFGNSVTSQFQYGFNIYFWGHAKGGASDQKLELKESSEYASSLRSDSCL